MHVFRSYFLGGLYNEIRKIDRVSIYLRPRVCLPQDDYKSISSMYRQPRRRLLHLAQEIQCLRPLLTSQDQRLKPSTRAFRLAFPYTDCSTYNIYICVCIIYCYYHTDTTLASSLICVLCSLKHKHLYARLRSETYASSYDSIV